LKICRRRFRIFASNRFVVTHKPDALSHKVMTFGKLSGEAVIEKIKHRARSRRFGRQRRATAFAIISENRPEWSLTDIGDFVAARR
jgi:long-subunit acyl-CoA synthetase (AMP-forming)